MSIIEGIGDEVTHFFIAVSIVLIVTIAWITTDIRQQWNIRTVYLLHRRRVRRTRSQRLTNHTESATISEGRDPVEGPSVSGEAVAEPSVQEPVAPKPPEPEDREGGSTSESREDTPLTSEEEEQSEIVRTMDGDLIRRRRLAFFQHERLLIDDLLEEQPFESQNGIASSIDSASQTQTEEQPSPKPQQSTIVHEPSPEQTDSNIIIKLKYINDDLKVVNGRLEELLGDFKRRHFEVELSSNKLVRLIFNGQVLQRDTDTLQSYGMFNNCVVHCLVHQRRMVAGDNGRMDNLDSVSRNGSNNNNQLQRDWDLGNLLIATVSFCLGSAWYFRYQYPQLFTVTATVGLVAITGIFTVISIGMYFPDTERTQQQQQQQQRQPAAAQEGEVR